MADPTIPTILMPHRGEASSLGFTILTGPLPPPVGVFTVGTRYWVIPPVEGQPAEFVFTPSLVWKVTSVVSE